MKLILTQRYITLTKQLNFEYKANTNHVHNINYQMIHSKTGRTWIYTQKEKRDTPRKQGDYPKMTSWPACLVLQRYYHVL